MTPHRRSPIRTLWWSLGWNFRSWLADREASAGEGRRCYRTFRSFRTVPAEPIDQGDIIDACPLITLDTEEVADVEVLPVRHSLERVIVLTQTCDLAQQRTTRAVVAVAHEAQYLVDQGLLKPADIRGPIRAGRVFGWYFLPQSAQFGMPESIVDLRQLHTVRIDLLLALIRRGRRRVRLQPLYREHLAKHFADTYSRIGLPEPYDTTP